MPRTRWLLAAALPLLGACRPDSPPEVPPRLKPLLETLPANYRPLNRQDTLSSFWAPDSLVADSTFQFTDAYRSQVLLRVQFVPASAATAAGLDTLRFRGTYLGLDEYTRPGYHWNFFPGRNPELTVAATADEVPLRMALTYSWRLALLEHQAWPGTSVVHERNSYLMDYPFETVAQARVGDSVVYVRAVPLLADQPRPDTLFTFYRAGPQRKRIPLVADQPDTSHHALLRLSFRVLHHSAD